MAGDLEELHFQILYGAVDAAWCCGAVLSIGRGVEYSIYYLIKLYTVALTSFIRYIIL